MRKKRLKFSVVLLLVLGLTKVQAQTSVNSSGGKATGSGGSVSYTVGQVFYTTNSSSSDGHVTQGIQQPYILVVNALEEAQGIELMVSAYPNPTTDYLIMEIKDIEISNLTYQLYDMNGILLQNEKILNSQTQIDISNLVTASYFVKVNQGSKEIKTFKIIKN